jgi:mannose-6-phosphate isomerase-like protein (cupin superfamily)
MRLGVFIIIIAMSSGTLVVAAEGEKAATFTKGKFAVPISREAIQLDWALRGYSEPKMQSYAQGWARGEHTHPVSLIMTIVTGRMEFVFEGQHVVVEPGDELFYPAYTMHSARNLYDGTTQMMEGYKR